MKGRRGSTTDLIKDDEERAADGAVITRPIPFISGDAPIGKAEGCGDARPRIHEGIFFDECDVVVYKICAQNVGEDGNGAKAGQEEGMF